MKDNLKHDFLHSKCYILKYLMNIQNMFIINSLWPIDTIWKYRSGSTLNTGINVDLPSKVFGGIHLRAILQKVTMTLICNMCLEITLLKLLLHLPGANELTFSTDHLLILHQSSTRNIIQYHNHCEAKHPFIFGSFSNIYEGHANHGC